MTYAAVSDSLRGLVAIIAGGSQGLGLEIARRYVKEGASLVLCARDANLLSTACAELQRAAGPAQSVTAVPSDVSDEADVNRLVSAALDRHGRVDVLVNCAGIYGPMGAIEDVDVREWKRTIEINILGAMLLCRAVIPGMKQRRRGKIIQLSGGGATGPMANISAYAASKAGVVRLVETLADEVGAFGIDVNALAPGALNTRMLDEVLAAGADRVGKAFHDRALKQKQTGGAGFEAGADLAVFLASESSNGITGKLISALWDDWRGWPDHMAELLASDVFTLRRLTGRDRDMPWGDR